MKTPGALAHTLTSLIRNTLPLDPVSMPTVPAEDWERLAEAAIAHGVAPLLYASLRGQSALGQVPTPVVERLREQYVSTGRANWLALVQLSRLLDQFTNQRIPVVLLKGAALALSLYPSIDLRPMVDIDLLIKHQDREQVFSLLTVNDFQRAEGIIDDFREPYGAEERFVRAGPNPLQIEPHWHVVDLPYYVQTIPIEWFWERTQRIKVERREARVLAPEAQLLHLCAHAGIHHAEGLNSDEPRLLWSYDVALLLSREGARMDWASVAAAAREFRLTPAVQNMLNRASEDWGVTVRVQAGSAQEMLRPSVRERIAYAAAGARQIAAGPLWDGLTAPELRRNRAYWWSALFPSAENMRWRYRVRHDSLLPFYYAARILAGAFKFGRSAWAGVRAWGSSQTTNPWRGIF